MATQALVCPHCRTWFEASGRTVRCPACNKRFGANEARLGSASSAPRHETVDFSREAPVDYHDQSSTPVETPREMPGWGIPERTPPGDDAHHGWGIPERPAPADDARHEWDLPYRDAVEHESQQPRSWDVAASSTEPAPRVEEPEAKATIFGISPQILFTIAIFAYIAVARYFIEGPLFLAGILALIGAQWLFSRSQRADGDGTG